MGTEGKGHSTALNKTQPLRPDGGLDMTSSHRMMATKPTTTRPTTTARVRKSNTSRVAGALGAGDGGALYGLVVSKQS
jgi:hypothetical protein